MARNDNLQDLLRDTANAIREKKGTSDLINPQDFPEEIASISGGEDMLQTIVDETRSCRYLFYAYSGTNSNIVKNLNTSNVTNMDYMFQDCKGLTSLDVSRLNTSSVNTMNYMFSYCAKLTSLDLSNFNTGLVTGMGWMFDQCIGLTSLDLSSFNTNKVTNMRSMFSGCIGLTSLDLSSFNTNKVTNMNDMFNSCIGLKSIYGSLDLINVTSLSVMFVACRALETVTLKNIRRAITLGSSTYGTYLTLDTLINTIKELWDLTGSTSQKLTIGTANISKLSNTYVKLITPTPEQEEQDPYINNKKPCEVCESTDEGAMLITDYISSKNWTLA